MNLVPLSADKNSSGVPTSSSSTKVVYPDTSRMLVYDPRQKIGIFVFTGLKDKGCAMVVLEPNQDVLEFMLIQEMIKL